MAVARESTRQAYQLRVQLRGVSPPIWRRILIACNATLADLHAVIQAAMGWEDIHLHQFTIRGQCYGVPLAGAVRLHAGTTDLRLSDFGLRVHERLGYAYDFHSGWWHDIRVEKVLSCPSVKQVPVCIAGIGACPPEDSGPPEHFMQALDERSVFDLLEWLEEELHGEFSRERVRDTLDDWMPWLERHFDRKGANARLKTLHCYSH